MPNENTKRKLETDDIETLNNAVRNTVFKFVDADNVDLEIYPGEEPDYDRNAWDRQEGETATSYQAFVIYRELGTGRTVRKAYEKYIADNPSKKSKAELRLEQGEQVNHKHHFVLRGYPFTWGEWCRLNNWRARADSWDFHMETVRRETLTQEHKESIGKYKQSVHQVANRKLNAFSKLYVIANEKLDAMRENDARAKEQAELWEQRRKANPTESFLGEHRLRPHDLDEYRVVSTILRNASLVADSGLSNEATVIEVEALLLELNSQRQKEQEI